MVNEGLQVGRLHQGTPVKHVGLFSHAYQEYLSLNCWAQIRLTIMMVAYFSDFTVALSLRLVTT